MPNYNDIFQEVINLEKNGHSKDALNIVRANILTNFRNIENAPHYYIILVGCKKGTTNTKPLSLYVITI